VVAGATRRFPIRLFLFAIPLPIALAQIFAHRTVSHFIVVMGHWQRGGSHHPGRASTSIARDHSSTQHTKPPHTVSSERA